MLHGTDELYKGILIREGEREGERARNKRVNGRN